MAKTLKWLGALLLLALLAGAGTGVWYLRTKQPLRQGTVPLAGLQAPVSVAYDERGVPHIQAQNEADLYRALGYVHAQDRLFQMEMVRRLANGELAEILGPKLTETDRLMRTLGLRHFAQTTASKLDMAQPSNQVLLAYLDGINQYQATHPTPLEFDVLGIPQRVFTAKDTIAVSGYLAYSFAAAFKTEPVLTHIRDKLGPDYLRVFDVEWNPQGVIAPLTLQTAHGQALEKFATLSDTALQAAGVPSFEGSNAWVIAGQRTASGKPLLAGDPHIAYSAPAVWYEAHLSAPGFELYGHFQALSPMALLGHNTQFGWSLTMFQNDDIDLIAEKTKPNNPNQIWHRDQWVDLQSRTETIAVKGDEPVVLTLRTSPHGPIITDAFTPALSSTPIAMWWTLLETDYTLMDAFYALNRANTRTLARDAAEKIHAPGLNILWASASGDIAWWAGGKLPIRPAGVNPMFILDGSTAQADKLGFYNFAFNPQEENPARGYIVSANHQPKPASGVPVPGYYNLSARAQRLDSVLRNPDQAWDTGAAQSLQLHVGTNYGPDMLADLMPLLKAVTTDPYEKAFLEPLEQWNGDYTTDSIAPLLFNQLLYEIAQGAMADELGNALFASLLRTRALDHALPRLAADAKSPWWDDVRTPQAESHFETLRLAWVRTLRHLEGLYGKDLTQWHWGRAHTLTHKHPLGMQKPLDRFFHVGPFAVPGGREIPNNLSSYIGPAPWEVITGPSTRRVIDFAAPGKAQGINPIGQSGVWGDAHYDDQSARFVAGYYVAQHLLAADVKANTKSQLLLQPAATQRK
jgi:penicillin G amidase